MSHFAMPAPKRRMTTAGAVVFLHAAVIYAFALAIGTIPVPIPTKFIVTTIPDPGAKKPVKPVDLPEAAIPAKPMDPLPFPQPFAADGGWHLSGNLIAPRLDPRYGMVQPPYPPESIRLGEEGRVTLALLVGADGRIVDARVDRSSGYPRLDAAALEGARRTLRFLPGTEDGQPRAMWHRITIAFRLDEVRGK